MPDINNENLPPQNIPEPSLPLAPPFEPEPMKIPRSSQQILIDRYAAIKRNMMLAVVILFCGAWAHMELTVYKHQSRTLRYGSTFNIGKGGSLWGWAHYAHPGEVITFHIRNSGNKPIDFADAAYYLNMKNGRKFRLELRQIKSVDLAKTVPRYMLSPRTGELTVVCDLGAAGSLFQGRMINPNRIAGFRITLRSGRAILFGYERLGFPGKIKRFLEIKAKNNPR